MPPRTSGTRRRRLKRVYTSEGDAAATLALTLAYREAPGDRVELAGFKPEINAQPRPICEAPHTMEDNSGQQHAELEVAG